MKKSQLKKRKPYAAVNVKQVNLESLIQGRDGQPAVVGVDMAKDTAKAIITWPDRSFSKAWWFANPLEIPACLDLLEGLGQGRKLTVAMEPTGTYGDAFRQGLEDRKLELQLVLGKASHDYAEVFDGVPSQHDVKDAAVVAELARDGKARAWPYQQRSDWEKELEYTVDELDTQARILAAWCGRLEGLVARFWPEATRILGLSSGVLLRVLEEYGSPAALAADAQAPSRLRQWGRVKLKAETLQALLASAGQSLGVRMGRLDVQHMQSYARQARQARQAVCAAKRQLKQLAQRKATLKRLGQKIGFATACVLWVSVGDPRKYHSAGAYIKALGLNLAERSSGRYQGQLKISKRGPSLARKWLYWVAMRLSQKGAARAWYQKKQVRDAGLKSPGMRGLVALMRKAAAGIWRSSRDGEEFEASRLFERRKGKKPKACSEVATASSMEPVAGEGGEKSSGPAKETGRLERVRRFLESGEASGPGVASES